MYVCVIRVVVVIDRKKNVATKRTSETAAALSVETDPISCSPHLFSLMILNFLYYHLNPTIGPTSLSLSLYLSLLSPLPLLYVCPTTFVRCRLWAKGEVREYR